MLKEAKISESRAILSHSVPSAGFSGLRCVQTNTQIGKRLCSFALSTARCGNICSNPMLLLYCQVWLGRNVTGLTGITR